VRVPSEEEVRVLVATDVLSEGQNLQDAHVVVNYDLPWAIIRLIQRAGRVDRVGQKADSILCYSFLPAEGVENIIRLRARVRERLRQNAEVVGTDEAFFEDDRRDGFLLDLYNEKSNVLDGETDTEVDLASYAYQIWKNAITENPKLQKTIPELPPVTYATKQHIPFGKDAPEGALVYMRTVEGNDALAWIDEQGDSVTESQYAILKAAECAPETKPLPRAENHHELVQKGVELIIREEKNVGGGLGRPSGARFRIYNRLKSYADSVRGTLFESEALLKTIDEIYRYPLRQATADVLNRQMRSGATDESLVQLVIALRDEDRLCVVHEEEQDGEPRIICSMGLRNAQA
jgi:superfamily II DNA helicase RecQ